MLDDVSVLMIANPEWALVLGAYRDVELDVPASPKPEPTEVESDESDSLVGWVERVREVAGVASTSLSGIHGRLIAHGLLKCDMGARSSGLVYRLSTAGKAALKAAHVASESPLAESA